MSGYKPPFVYIEPEDLKDWLKTKPREEFLILDVRDEDEYRGGHIIDAKLFPSDQWWDNNKVKAFLQGNLHYKYIVMHCFKSQQRGPTCANILADTMLEIKPENPPQIMVLRGGFEKFDYRFRRENGLITR